jgi:hypothetical protein
MVTGHSPTRLHGVVLTETLDWCSPDASARSTPGVMQALPPVAVPIVSYLRLPCTCHKETGFGLSATSSASRIAVCKPLPHSTLAMFQ